MQQDKDPRILVFDSGLGGLSVLQALVECMPLANYVYLADDARFPYGDLTDETLTDGLIALLHEANADFQPDLIVIACNTASTVALETIRDEFFVPIVGIVPAIKPAAAATRSGKFAVLATPGTIRRAYTQDLIREFAAGCSVKLVPCETLAAMAEEYALTGQWDEERLRAEILPVFNGVDCLATDVIVLGCTHYPLILPALVKVTPRSINWINPASAVARRVMHLLMQEWQNCLEGQCHAYEQTRARIAFVTTNGPGGEARLRDAWAAINGQKMV